MIEKMKLLHITGPKYDIDREIGSASCRERV